jgi:hypothetical protein
MIYQILLRALRTEVGDISLKYEYCSRGICDISLKYASTAVACSELAFSLAHCLLTNFSPANLQQCHLTRKCGTFSSTDYVSRGKSAMFSQSCDSITWEVGTSR